MRRFTPSDAASPSERYGATSPNVASLRGEETVVSFLGEETVRFSPQRGEYRQSRGGGRAPLQLEVYS